MSGFELSPGQRAVLTAVSDACFAAHGPTEVAKTRAIVSSSAPDWQNERLEAFVTTKFSDLSGSIDALAQQFVTSLSKDNVQKIGLVLSLLATRPGTLLLTGHVGLFVDLTVAQREAVLQSWRVSSLPLLRQAFRGLVSISLYVAYNLFDEVIFATGYPALGDEKRNLDPNRLRPHYPYVFERIDLPYKVIETDMLVVGSGAGGGVVASELAKKGWKVLVVEKGEYVKPEDMVGTQREGFKHLYEGQGLMATEDGSMNILAGSGFGGGTTINWSASLRPQHFIREQWSKDHGLPYFLSTEFAQSIEFVCDRMGVSDENLQHSKANQLLVDGSKKLGYPISKIPQNTGGHAHPCGYCGFGCTYGEKQGGTVTWLRDAAEHGAQFLIETTVERLLFASSPDAPTPTKQELDRCTPTSSRRHCIGALVKSREGEYAIVRARQAVVVSAGTIHSPAVLMRSGLKNPRIGRNLRLHPVSFTTGFYEEPVRPWEGAIMTAVSNVQENWDGSHHGVKIEVIQSFPGGQAASFMPWTSSFDHKLAMAQYGHQLTFIAICRDRGSGRVFLDSENKPRLDYTPNAYDCVSLVRGTIASAEIHLVNGAKRISTTQVDVEDYYPAPGHKYLSDPAWQEWLAKVERAGIRPSRCAIGSAHQMGSCQMGSKPSTSVVDPRGRVWGAEQLYVADASVFPTASGVNPMITNMALSHSIARFIDEDMHEEASQPISAHL
ncbi:hypothetical protein Rhopal_003727-T1 [Rhodotorula paludigena]|uniref:Long-chain-alcohol oxidase n=1 Tax=Rhodotorula paludigena TaxID=86838 RepID=A0AAV5GPW6_9BASI|nr:hypothetical protein Rhopal_003727-T1 [Rhodotorula paludigena]